MDSIGISNRDDVSEHRKVVFYIFSDGSNQEGLETTKESVEAQNYDNIELFPCSSVTIKHMLDSLSDEDVVFLVRAGDSLASEDVCVRLASQITKDVKCIYCDSMIRSGDDELHQLLPPFSLDLTLSGYILANVIISADLLKALELNDSLDSLFNHDIILKSSSLSKVTHFAELGFTIPSRAVDIAEESKRLKGLNA